MVSYQCDDFSSNESKTEIDQQQLNDKQVIAALKKQLQEKDEKIQKQSQELREKDEIIKDLQQTNQAGVFNVLSNSFKELHVFEDEKLVKCKLYRILICIFYLLLKFFFNLAYKHPTVISEQLFKLFIKLLKNYLNLHVNKISYKLFLL